MELLITYPKKTRDIKIHLPTICTPSGHSLGRAARRAAVSRLEPELSIGQVQKGATKKKIILLLRGRAAFPSLSSPPLPSLPCPLPIPSLPSRAPGGLLLPYAESL